MSHARPEYLVDTEWVAQNVNNPNVRIIESDEDPLLYAISHIPNAAQVDWFTTLQHPLRRDFVAREQFEAVASSLGVTNDTTVVFYGDKSNWFACYALWLFQYYGHQNVKIMNGAIPWSRTMTVPGPSGATWWMRRSKNKPQAHTVERGDIFQTSVCIRVHL